MAELNFSLEKVYWKEEVPVDITPTTEPQTVTPEAGQAFNRVNVGAIPASVLQDKVVTPTEQTQNVRADAGFDGLDEVQVNPIPPEYVVPSGTENITTNGDYDIADKASAHVAVEPVLENKTVTPTEQTQTVKADAGHDGLDTVTVNPIPPEYVVPTGSVDITQNGQGIDVSGKAEVNVNVPQGVFPSGTKLITQNVTGEDVTDYAAVDVVVPGPTGTKQISITQNGTTTEDVSDYADAKITVNVPVGIVNGEFGKIDKQTIIAGENSIAGMEQMRQYIESAISDSPHGNNGFCVASAQLKTQYNTAHEFLVMVNGGNAFKAYRAEPNPLHLYECGIHNGYLCTLVPGTQIDVYIPYFDFSDLPL